MSTIQTSCLPCAIYFCLSLSARAQTNPIDTTQSIPAARATVYYQANIGQDAALYNGIAYQQNYRDVEGDPYFQTANLKTGTVTYEDITYTHIPLLYDLVHDQLVISDKTGQLLIPPPEKISRFTFDDHNFVRLTVNNTTSYYEFLRSGYVSLLIRHIRTITEKIEDRNLRRIIDSRRQYFLCKQHRYYPIDSEKQLLILLNDKKNELNEFLHGSNISFRKDPEKGMEAVIDYYNQLPH